MLLQFKPLLDSQQDLYKENSTEKLNAAHSYELDKGNGAKLRCIAPNAKSVFLHKNDMKAWGEFSQAHGEMNASNFEILVPNLSCRAAYNQQEWTNTASVGPHNIQQSTLGFASQINLIPSDSSSKEPCQIELFFTQTQPPHLLTSTDADFSAFFAICLNTYFGTLDGPRTTLTCYVFLMLVVPNSKNLEIYF